MNNTDIRDILLAVVGVYLIYLAYQLFTGLSEGGINIVVGVIAIAVFAVVGILVIVRSILRLYRNHKKE